MNHPLLERVRSVGRSSRRLMLLYGVCCVLALTLSVAFLLGLADYGLRFSDAGVRWLCFGAILTVGGAAVYRFLIPALRYRRNEIQLARLIERRHPSLGDQLSSTIAFLDQPENDPLAGSPALRRRVVTDTSARVEQIDFADVVSRRTPLRALAAAVFTCAAIGAAFVVAPSSSSLAARRLFAPWNAEAWPRRNQLQFIDAPGRLAVGSDLDVQLRDANQRVPDEVMFEYRFRGESTVHRKRMKLNRASLRFSYQVSNVDRSLEFRAVGGDDETRWHSVTAITPARIASLRATVHLPEYAGSSASQSDGRIRALVGSRVTLQARASVPLAQVKMMLDNGSETVQVPVELSADGLSLRVGYDNLTPWIIRSSGRYWFEMTEQQHPVAEEPRIFEIDAIEDLPPKILLDEPGNHSYVTRQARLPLRGMVEDDLGIKTIDLQSWLDADGPDATQQTALFRAESAGEGGSDAVSELATRYPVDYLWDLGRQTQLQPGMTLSFRLSADDFKPQSSQFEPRKLTIISEGELLDRIGRRQSQLLEQLAESLRILREVRTSIGEIGLQLDAPLSAQSVPLDEMQGAELRQRRVQQMLTGAGRGVTGELADLMDQLDANRIDDPELRHGLNEMLVELSRIDREHLTPAQRNLVQAMEIARALQLRSASDAGGAAQLKQIIGETGQKQDQAILSLEQLIGDLSQWDSFQRVGRELRYLRQQQEKLARDTEQHRIGTIGIDFSGLDAQQRTDLRKLTLRQSAQARDFEKLLGDMSRMAKEMTGQQPLVAATLGDAVATANRLGIAASLRDAGAAIGENRVATAVRTQQQTVEQLREMLDVLSNRSENSLDRRLRQLIEASDELEELREQVQSLRRQVDAAHGSPASASRDQQLERLEKQREAQTQSLSRLARRLQRLGAAAAADSAEKAANSLSQSTSPRSSDSDQRAEESERLIDEAQRRLGEDIRRMRQQLVRERMTRLGRQVAGLVARQEGLVARVQQYDLLLSQHGSLSPAQTRGVLQASRQQRTLALETNSLSGNTPSEAFRIALSGAAREMLRATARLSRRQIGPETQENQRSALRRLKHLVEALRQENAPPDSKAQPGELGDLAPEQAVRLLAELKLLKLMQAEVQRRTMELETAGVTAGGSLSERQQQELRDLASEQGRLADLIFNLSRPLDQAEGPSAQRPGTAPAEDSPGAELLPEDLPE